MMEEFNVLTRRGGGAEDAILATKMKFNVPLQTLAFERFRVLTCPDSISVERVELELVTSVAVSATSANAKSSNASFELLRHRPSYCGIRLGNGRRWEVIFESKEYCRTFAKQVKGRVSLDGEFYAEEENGAGFEVTTEEDPDAVLLMVGNSVFFRSSLQGKNNMPWRDVTLTQWRRGNSGKQLIAEAEASDEVMQIEFRTRAARERFLGRLPKTNERQVVRVFSGTWNVGNSAPPTARELVRSWLDLANPVEKTTSGSSMTTSVGNGEESSSHFDIYAFGLQECSKKDEWIKALMGALAIHLNAVEEEVAKVCVVAMREVILAVFCRSTLNFTTLGQDVRATGIANTIGNKGAVGIGINFYEFGTIAFVSAHLSAFQGNVKRRAQDQRAILKHLNLAGSVSAPLESQSSSYSSLPGGGNAVSTGGEGAEFDNIELFDRVIFMGDLNYRIDMGSSNTPEEFTKVESMVRGGRWAELAQYDQLSSEMRKEKVFFGYQEAKPVGSFPPTYRMMKDQQGYSNKRDQNPSFTDRVLVRGDMSTLTYGATHELVVRPDRTLTCSDHRPVYAAVEWEEEEKSWRENVSFDGANQKDISIKFNNITFRPLSGSSSASSATGMLSFVGSSERTLLIDENTSRLPDLEEPRGNNGLTSKRRLSGFATLMRRSSSAPMPSTLDDEDTLLDDLISPGMDLDATNFLIDESLEFRILTTCSTEYPSTCDIVGNNGYVRTFVTENRLRNSSVRIGVFTRPRKLIGFARFRLPVTISFEDEVSLEVPVGSRGARVGDLCLRLQLVQG